VPLSTHHLGRIIRGCQFWRINGERYHFGMNGLLDDRGTFTRALGALPGLLLAGCGLTALQLQQATDPLSDSVPELLTAQIAHNVIAKRFNPYALPAQVVVGTGQAQVSNQLILPMATVNFEGIALRSIGLQNQNQWQQSWSVSAVTDIGDLQRLDALYRYANNSDTTFTICRFIEQYNRAIISQASVTTLRISNIPPDDEATPEDPNAKRDSVEARKDDYAQYVELATPSTNDLTQKKTPAGKNVKVQLSFGPPTTLPLPPKSAAQKCRGHPDRNYNDLKPQNWPVPLPAKPFIWIEGLDAIPPEGDPKAVFENRHELRAVYVNPEAFAQFQLWVFGATVNTASSQGAAPSPSPKAISGSTG
jgi:hypothetical protein